MSEKAKISFNKQNNDVQKKMLIASSSKLKEVVSNIVEKIFSVNNINDDNISFFRSLIIEISPWKNNYSNEIQNMIKVKDKRIGKLFYVLNTAIIV